MKENKSLFKDVYAIIPLVISGLLFIGVAFLLKQRVVKSPDFILKLEEILPVFLSISGFLAGIIVMYLAFTAANMKKSRATAIDTLSSVTKKMHDFRRIIDLLMNSKMWMPGLTEYIDEEFAGLNFFDVKEFYKGRSKLAIEFLQENHPFQDTENLYLELKSLMLLNLKQKHLPDTISFPKMYNKEIVSKWIEHKCGSGLWYFFGYKYGHYKENLKYEAVFERHQEKIIALALSIDSQLFDDSTFNEVFLAKLGEHMSNEVMPRLLHYQDQTDKKMPVLLRYLYLVFLSLIICGVILPLSYLLLSLPIIILILSFSFVISVLFFLTISFYQFMIKEVNS